MSDQPAHPMAVAMNWVARVFAAALAMVLPGLAGRWLDERWGTGFLQATGFVLGMISGVVYLIAMTRQADSARRMRRDSGEAQERDGGPPIAPLE
jgi:hypothetical protein